MTDRADVARGREIVARWCALAEARLEHLTELFETGRWRRYHTEAAFLENVREAKRAVETWHDLLRREAARDNSPIDISWLGRRDGALLADRFREEWRAAPKLPEAAVKPPLYVAPIAAAPEKPRPQQDAVAAETPPHKTAIPVPLLDLAAMQARYPLLRNSL